MAAKGGQELPGARPGNAFPALNQKQGSMGRALDQAGAGVEELVGLPFQRHTTVGAAIFIGLDLTGPTHDKQADAVLFKAQAGAFCQRR